MNCFLCKGSLTAATTSYMTTCCNCCIIIKNVPCSKCDQCGEEFIDGTALLKIQKIVDSLSPMMVEVAVVDFKSVA